MKKQLTVLILITSMLCALCADAFPIGATVETLSEIALEPRPAVMDDALVILIHLAKIELLSEEEQVPLDLNYNSKIDIGDMLIVLMGLANIIPHPMIVPVYAEPNLPVETTEPPAITTEPPEGGLEPLSKELELRIKNDFLASPIVQEFYSTRYTVYTVDDVEIENFLGIYNGSVALRIQCTDWCYLTEGWSEVVAGYEFWYGSSYRILVWNDGSFYRLSERGGTFSNLPAAYAEGLLTEQNIADIWYYYNYKELEPLSKELELRIKSDFLAYRWEIDSLSVDDAIIGKYLGTYNNSVVLMIHHRFEHFFLPAWCENVDGYEFWYSSSQRILIWNNGILYRLSTLDGEYNLDSNLFGAYEEGLLTAKNIGDIWYYYNYTPYIF